MLILELLSALEFESGCVLSIWVFHSTDSEEELSYCEMLLF